MRVCILSSVARIFLEKGPEKEQKKTKELWRKIKREGGFLQRSNPCYNWLYFTFWFFSFLPFSISPSIHSHLLHLPPLPLLLLFPLPLPLLLHCITQVSQCTRLLQSIVIFSAFLLPPSSSSSSLRLSSSKVCYNRKAAKQREDFSMRHLQTKTLPWFHIPMKTHPPK